MKKSLNNIKRYEKSEFIEGRLDSRDTRLFVYSLSNSLTNYPSKLIPKGTISVRDYVFTDGYHGQILQLIKNKNEILETGKELKNFKDGNLKKEDLIGDIIELKPREVVNLEALLKGDEKISFFKKIKISGNLKKNNKNKKINQVKMLLGFSTLIFLSGIYTGLELNENKEYLINKKDEIINEYIQPGYKTIEKYIEKYNFSK